MVIAPTSKQNIDNEWDNSNFDVVTFCYDGSHSLLKDYDIHFNLTGVFKYPAIQHIITTIEADYDYFWFPDDDLRIDSKDVNVLFDTMKELDLNLAQPSVSGFLTFYKFFRANKKYQTRKTNFVEMMCPCFSKEFLDKCLETFSYNVSGFGMELYWSSFSEFEKNRIIDKITVVHTREIKGGDYYKSLAKLGVNPSDELREVCKKFKIKDIMSMVEVEGGLSFK